MCLRLKEGIDPEVLRRYGFHLGREDFGKERWCEDGYGYSYQANWYHKFLMYDEQIGFNGIGVGEIAYTDDEFDIPMVQLLFRIGDGNNLYIECAPSCTYYIGGHELDVVSDTIFQLTQDGIIEKIQ